MFYVGDLSVQDVNVLSSLCQGASSILEFGVGASTQIFAQVAPRHAKIISVETEPGWITRVRAILEIMTLDSRVQFSSYDEWLETTKEKFLVSHDLIFDDGVDNLRADFADRSWPLLKIGGSLVFHDTRRIGDFMNASRFCQQHYLEVSCIQINAHSSNLTVVTKKLAEPYVNWNVVEDRPRVVSGFESPEATLAYVREILGRS
jgi:predicted O-methyltransferase YrrM